MLGLVVDLWERTGVDEWVVATAGVLIGLTVIVQKVIRPMWRALKQGAAAFRQGAAAWDWIEAQMKPNGGDSLRDKINQIADLAAEAVDATKAIPALAERVDIIPALVERIENLERIVLENTKERSS